MEVIPKIPEMIARTWKNCRFLLLNEPAWILYWRRLSLRGQLGAIMLLRFFVLRWRRTIITGVNACGNNYIYS